MIDTKQYRGRLRLDQYGMVWRGRHLLVPALRTTLWEADQADEVLGVADIRVPAIMAIHGATVPSGRLQADGVIIAPARQSVMTSGVDGREVLAEQVEHFMASWPSGGCKASERLGDWSWSSLTLITLG